MQGLDNIAAGVKAAALANINFVGRVAGSIGTYEPPASRRKPTFTRHPGAKKRRRKGSPAHYSLMLKREIQAQRAKRFSSVPMFVVTGWDEALP